MRFPGWPHLFSQNEILPSLQHMGTHMHTYTHTQLSSPISHRLPWDAGVITVKQLRRGLTVRWGARKRLWCCRWCLPLQSSVNEPLCSNVILWSFLLPGHRKESPLRIGSSHAALFIVDGLLFIFIFFNRIIVFLHHANFNYTFLTSIILPDRSNFWRDFNIFLQALNKIASKRPKKKKKIVGDKKILCFSNI